MMTRDFFLKLTRSFIREDGKQLSFFWEVSETIDKISKEIFDEIFDSRDTLTEVFKKALGRVDEVQATIA